MAMLAVLIAGASWWTVTAISRPVSRVAETRAHNAHVLQRAKKALIGWVATTAANNAENNPGRLPCPEAAGNIGTANEGIAAGNCTLPAVGRLPWRTLGIDRPRDASGETLWYVVSAAWALSNGTAPPLTTFINSNTLGQLTLDGTGDMVALIIAPGPPLQVSASPSCIARTQRRPAPSPAIDLRDYLECDNATLPADAVFASTGPANSFNDQVLAVTGLEVLPTIEAAVADRFWRNIAPVLRAVYTAGPAGATWGTLVLPFAAPFADPAASTFQGTLGTTVGLLPLSLSETAPGSGVPCTVAAQGPRCAPAFVAWTNAALGGNPAIYSANCVANPTQIDCTFYRRCVLFCAAGNMPFTLTAGAANVGMALRQINNAAAMTNVNPAGRNSTGVINNDGSATMTLNAQASVGGGFGFGGALGNLLCGGLPFFNVCKLETISVPIDYLADHPILDPANAALGWFIRNSWHQVSYYAVAPKFAPDGARIACAGAADANCLTVNFATTPANPLPPLSNQSGLLVIAGRALAGQARPPAPPTPMQETDWLEGANCDFNPGPGNCVPDTTYTVRGLSPLMINRTFNDRISRLDP